MRSRFVFMLVTASAALGCIAPMRPLLKEASERAPAAATVAREFATAIFGFGEAHAASFVEGGAQHPLFLILGPRYQRARARGATFQEIRVGQVEVFAPATAVVRAHALMVTQQPPSRVGRTLHIVLVYRLGAWRVTMWGKAEHAERHVAWLRDGGQPLDDPQIRPHGSAHEEY